MVNRPGVEMEHPMVRTLIALSGAAALTLLLFSGVASPADARSGHGNSGSYSGHRSSGGAYSAHRYAGPSRNYGSFANSHRNHGRFHRRVFVGVPFAYGAYYPYYYDGGGCYWLRRRAVATGSPYWWSRYDACLSGYYGY
jgi:hypothetical protein